MPASHRKPFTMTSNEILKADVLDIVFDNRNKKYGAYLLRKYYNNRLMIGLSGMLGFVLVIVLIVGLNPGVREAIASITDPDVVTLQTLPDAPPELPEPVQPPRSNIRTEHFVNRIEIVDDHVETNVPDQDVLIDAAFSDHHEEGSPLVGNQQPSSAGNVNDPPLTVEEPASPSPVPSAAAEFPGGQKKWMEFLNRHLRTPGELEAGQKKSVLVRFSVGEDGSVTQFEIVQSGGILFDNEVIRVLKKMPRWKPAVQNGRNVSVLFTQPVTFVAFEE